MMCHGLAVGWSIFQQARRKKHGAGPQKLHHAFGSAICAHHLCYGQHHPTSWSCLFARWWMMGRRAV
jgi:hypothetical protein